MVEADTVTEVAEALTNGTCPPEDTGKDVIEKNGVDKEEDSKEVRKTETLESDNDHELEKEKESKTEEDKEETEPVKMEEEKDSREENEREKVEEKVDETKEEKEKAEETKEEEDTAEESKEELGSKKRRRGKAVELKEESKKKDLNDKKAREPITPVVSSVDRPVRERKSVERLVASVEKEQVKGFLIEKGRGTALKDIPNVAYKLSRKRTDETFKMLHMILFGRRGKAFQVKSNLSQFSGFAWHENEEKQKLKIKEKFDKCVKEKLAEFCDVLDIHVAKATTRKEDMITKLLDFLAAPHATTDVLLAEKEQSGKAKKRKRGIEGSVLKSGVTTAKRSARKRRKNDDTPKEKKAAPETENESQEEEDEENEKGDPNESEDEMAEDPLSEEKEDDSEEETGKHKPGLKKSSSNKGSSGKTRNKKLNSPKKVTPVTSPQKIPKKSSSKHSKNDDSSHTSPKVFSRKKKNEETAKKKSSIPSKSVKENHSKEKTGKKVAKGKDKRKLDSGPSEDELRKLICEILKEVDFNTATFTDILKQLAQHFDMDLTPRKSAIKLIIQEELTKLADEEEENEEDKDSEADNDPEAVGQEVRA